MFLMLIQKEIMHHILSIRFVALIFMCLLLIPLTLSINYHKYRQNQVDYQEAVKRFSAEAKENPPDAQNPNTEVSKLFLKPTPLSVFTNGLEEALPTYIGITRNGIKHGSVGLSQVPISHALGNLDFLFIASTVFSLLALLFTFDVVAGEKEAGTLRITLANALPRDQFLWGKLIGGYLVFVVPFLVSFLMGLLLIVWQGFSLDEAHVFLRVIYLTLVSLLYIAVFFGMGVVVSIYLDSAKTALIVAFALWVIVVLIMPRVGFLMAKLIAPIGTEQSVYMEKTVLRDNLNAEMQQKINEKMVTIFGGGSQTITLERQKELKEIRAPIEEEYRMRFQKRANKINLDYQRRKERQEQIGEILSRFTPTFSLIYLAMNLTQTGKEKRNVYFQTGDRYYAQLDAEYFSNVSDDVLAQILQMTARMGPSKSNTQKISPPPDVVEPTLKETLRHSVVDILLLCFSAVVFMTIAFLKFLRLDI